MSKLDNYHNIVEKQIKLYCDAKHYDFKRYLIKSFNFFKKIYKYIVLNTNILVFAIKNNKPYIPQNERFMNVYICIRRINITPINYNWRHHKNLTYNILYNYQPICLDDANKLLTKYKAGINLDYRLKLIDISNNSTRPN